MKAVISAMFLAPAANAAICSTPRMSVQGADTLVSRDYANGLKSGKPFITYEHGVAWRALEMVYNATNNASYVDHIQKGVDQIVTAEGSLNDYNLTYYTLDDIRIGESLIYLNKETGDAKYKGAADLLRSQLQTNPRNPEGGYWHRSTYPNQMWLDGLYMVSPFYTHYTSFYDPSNTTAYDDIVKQFTLTHTGCANSNASQKGLLKHGYDSSLKAVWVDAKGASPEVWDRALGWYVIAIVDVLDYLPASHLGVETLKAILSETIAAVKKAVDIESGMWWLVMSQPGRTGNYIESSAAAMFVYAMLKGIRMGYLDSATYLGTATNAYENMVDKFVKVGTDGGLDWEGTVSVGSLSGKGDYDYYISVALAANDLKGFGPFIMASVEYEKAVC